MGSRASKAMEAFENPEMGRDYSILFDCPEFTCLCPLTGQPDFAHFRIRYVPDQKCVELKSLKLYLWTFRDEGAFHEKVTNEILGNLAKLLDPRFLEVDAKWYVRGGITTYVRVTHQQDGWRVTTELDQRPW